MAQILVVDDEIGIRELLSEILADEGHDVLLADSAGEARRAEGFELRSVEAVVPHHPIPVARPGPVLLRLLLLPGSRLRGSGRRLGEGCCAGEREDRGCCESDELCHGHLL